ncbi:permease-like cell division protein FtsX [Solemya velesiana gill symbiont]|uniref:Cell division protein FtsX n=1 Tax=Solemya velesiana gill symbiont TaxID=1918948 RepID=A0A1T2KU15_9GAMM|nr:permease-like cell division protein FtsX [Solemya velesiana gill symbiont]OOZ36291.1 cell division protein [Solemya velesiana gill symbiont]
MATKRKKATHTGQRRSLRLDIWFMRHLQVSLSSLGRLSRNPVSTLMTAAVIGIALSLPIGLHLLLNNAQQLSGNWDGAASISLFLTKETGQESATKLAARLRLQDEIEHVQLISREEALEEFRTLSGFSSVLDSLEGNPLPNVLIIEPGEKHSSPEAAEQLLGELEKIREVEFAQLDLQWVRRFQGITQIAKRAVWVLGTLLGIAVLLIVGNTIRLEIQNRHAEIEITKLIGGTNTFIRRPFLYSGFWYGLFGGIIAWLLVTLSLILLDSPVEKLAGLYGSQFGLSGVDLTTFALLLGGSSLLGLCGSWIAVGRHLSEIEPT